MIRTSSGWTCHFFEELPSTQDKAFELDRLASYASRLAVVAKRQIAGRGRVGNVWVGLGGNFFGSFVIHPRISLKAAGQFSFLTAVALSDTLEKYLPRACKIEHKWPNDVLLNGKKGAGILIESEGDLSGRVRSLVIGVGVNLAAAPEGAVSLRDVLSLPPPTPEDFLEELLINLSAQMNKMEHAGFPVLREAWLARARGLGDTIRVRLPHEQIEGVFEGLAEDGALRLRIKGRNEPLLIHSGDVFFS